MPTEFAGRTVVEILDAPSKDRMQLLRQTLLSRSVLEKALRNSGLLLDAMQAEKQIDALQKQVEAKVEGSFLTITVRAGQTDSPKLAAALATALQEDMKEEVFTAQRLRSQAVEAHTNIAEEDVAKARAILLDIAKKHGLRPDGTGGPDAAELQLVTQRLAKVTIDLALLAGQQRLLAKEDLRAADGIAAPLLGLKAPTRALTNWLEAQREAAAYGAPGDAAAKADQKKNELKDQIAYAVVALEQKKAALEADRAALSAAKESLLSQELVNEVHKEEWREAKANHERYEALLKKLRDEATLARVDQSVVLRPLRIVETARQVREPARKALRGIRAASALSATLLIACLLTAVTRRLCRAC